ncbi:MAG: helix-turn-helix transcriptional regulator [Muribaculaceae bacterium]|nr:helix-turn-helix transcriptional regulator [Muribaculaceae bacterium]
MNDDIQRIDTVDEYNKLMGIDTKNPLVSVIDFSKTNCCLDFPAGHSFGFYAVFLKDARCGDMKYGRNYYDYQDGTLVFLSPEQIIKIENRTKHAPQGWALLFHPDLLRGTHLAREMKNYSFFSYKVFEALHLSLEERIMVIDCFKNIFIELSRPIDKHSKTLIVSNIELFLNYALRFYDRQFITRANVNSDILSRFESLLNEYFISDAPKAMGIPSVKYCAEKLNISPNYLSDLLRKDTGKSAIEHIQNKLIESAKNKLYDPKNSVSEIAYSLGFEYPQYFSRFFKKYVGVTPNQYRQ